MRARPVLSAVLVAILAMSLSGCDQIKNAIAPPPTIKHVTIAPRVAAPGAKVVGTLKNAVPSNLPLWPGSTLLAERLTKGANGNSLSWTFLSTDPYQEIVNGTAKGFQDASWQVMEQDVSSTESSVTVFTVSSSSGEGVVTVTAKPNKTTWIVYVVSPSK